MEVEIEDPGITIIEDNIESSEHKENLIKEYIANHQRYQALDFQFHTDGSLGNSLDKEKRMGAAWIQTKGPNPGNSFAAGISDWPSSDRAELAAIILATLTVPLESKVEIVTDSASCINTYTKLSLPNPRRTIRRWIKEKNWSLWMRLLEIIRKKKIKICFTKVTAHSGNPSNEKADRLAKEARNFPEIIWKDPRRPIWSTLPIWNHLVIDISLREFIKEIHKKETIIEWSQQNRILKQWTKEIEEQEKHSWNNFWKHCRQGSSLQTSTKQAKERSFRIKLMNNELPTLCNLRKRKPNIYKEATCTACEEEDESTEHIFNCPASLDTRLQIWEKVKEKLIIKFYSISSKKNNNNKNRKDQPTNLLHLIDQWAARTSNSSQDLINMCLGLFDKTDIQTWNEKAKEDDLRISEGQLILDLLSQRLLKLFRKKIWIPRCERTIKWERTQGIHNKLKKKKEEPPRKRRREENKKSQALDTRKLLEEQSGKRKKPIEQEQKKTSNQYKKKNTKENQDLGNRVKETIWNWIKEGKKWLGY
jgi:ribonuclease HI